MNIIKTAHRCIMLGFCTAAGFGNLNNYNHSESVYYDCGGYVYEGGKESEEIAQSGDSDWIDCRADLFIGMIKWWNNEQLLMQCKLPQGMEHKTLYFSVLMYEAEDVIGISV